MSVVPGVQLLGEKDLLVYLESHVDADSGTVYFRCGLCAFVSNYKHVVKNHLVRKHMAPTYDRCPHCKAVFKNKKSLENHFHAKRCPLKFD